MRRKSAGRTSRCCSPSGYTRNAIVHGGRLDAGVALIGKPFTYAALAEKIRQVLSSEGDR